MADKLYGTVLLKAKRIMDVLSASENSLTLEQISSAAAIPKPTTFKILNTLDYINFVRKDKSEKKYSLGTNLIGYGSRAMSSFDIVTIAEPYLTELNKVTSETVNLGIEEHDQIVLLKKIDSPQPVNLNSKVGGTLELYSSSMGKAILATKTEIELDQYFSSVELRPCTPNTITSIAELKKQIAAVQDEGYAIDNQENQAGVVCVGAAIQKYGKVFGAISVSTPKYRLDELLLSDLKKLVKSTVDQINQII
ncbi:MULTISPECIES: IclR family transcriptional regulator [Lactobacillus]|uniref:IclR family transcriptional regulator n=1 Tax=Lactobacillus TaxID=1578 RepID=UPI0018DB424B|nr:MULTISPECIES: IclR family transcriptional regulator [unclassified Lactobacillus]MBI0122004.1 IclR family transcriptional regulator [Lactobacillus sp. M0398]MBI0123880.1 IclR family transcriptional regulator [Lactobacillus sp. W8174]MBI0136048.1 IclR family transcriptional regulator [Lactobacillus sp. W8173]